MLKELIPLINERGTFRKQLRQQGLEDEDIFAAMQKYPPVYCFIADLHDFIQKVYRNQTGANQIRSAIETIFTKGRLINLFFIAAVNISQTPGIDIHAAYKTFVSEHRGVVLGGPLAKQRIFQHQNISFNEREKPLRVGQGYAACTEDNQEVARIVVPQNRGLRLP